MKNYRKSGRKLKRDMIFNDNNCYTVETVLSGHPDKICDQICDAILDEYIRADKCANVTVECMGSNDTLFIGGEASSSYEFDVSALAINTYRNIGYDNKLTIVNKLHKESMQTNQPLLDNLAGDQGIMYGYACQNEDNNNYLPYGINLINSIAREIDSYRKRTTLLLPDGKVQLTISDKTLKNLVLCVQHKPEADLEFLKQDILNLLWDKYPELKMSERIFFNHNSHFTEGGFAIDAGLSGRKIIADTYCGLIPHGGGSFSGKDPYRLDRSAAYMMRFVAKNLVANHFCNSCLLSVAYVFGYEKPVMLTLKTDKMENDRKLLDFVHRKFDFRPKGIVELLDLYNTTYQPTARYGHFTNPYYPWERIIAL